VRASELARVWLGLRGGGVDRTDAEQGWARWEGGESASA
jgi:hypothetical protein